MSSRRSTGPILTPVEASGALGGKGQPVHAQGTLPQNAFREGPNIQICAQFYPINNGTGQSPILFLEPHSSLLLYSNVCSNNMAVSYGRWFTILGQQLCLWLSGNRPRLALAARLETQYKGNMGNCCSKSVSAIAEWVSKGNVEAALYLYWDDALPPLPAELRNLHVYGLRCPTALFGLS